MASDTITMLTDTLTLELSNVRRAANRKRYAITKSETPVDANVLKSVLSTPAEGEEQYVATLKSAKADEKAIAAATALFRLNAGFKDVLKPEYLEAAGLVAKAAKEPDGDEQGDDESDEDYETRMEKARKSRSKKATDTTGVAPNFKPVRKSDLDPALAKEFDLVTKSNDALSAQVKELVARNKHLELTAKAEREFAHVPGSAEEHANLMALATAAGPEAEKAIQAHLASMEMVGKSSDLLREIGSTGAGGAQPATAHAKIMALADKLTMKSERGAEMTREQKYAYVVSKTPEGRELYTQHLQEQAEAQRRR